MLLNNKIYGSFLYHLILCPAQYCAQSGFKEKVKTRLRKAEAKLNYIHSGAAEGHLAY